MVQKNKKNLIVLTGPTAVGKSDLSILLAKKTGGEIISADSMQVYRRMNIGTAKITKEQMQGITHHLIDILEPQEEFNITKFQQLACAAIQDINSRGNLPIITGGTGFYIQSVLYDIQFQKEPQASFYREKWLKILDEKGRDFLYEALQKVDPGSAMKIHPHNSKRLIRALEYYDMNQEPIFAHNQLQAQRTSPYNFVYLVLTRERSRLYERIDKRVDQMIAEGLVEEVKNLKAEGCNKDMVSMQGLGYKEIFAYLEGALSLEEAVFQIKRDTRHFAKRQLTWFRREKETTWIDLDQFNLAEEILTKIEEILFERGIIVS